MGRDRLIWPPEQQCEFGVLEPRCCPAEFHRGPPFVQKGPGRRARRDSAAVTAGPIGVVALWLDIVYPRRHRMLLDRVRRIGVLVGEQPFGVPPERGHSPEPDFIVALADIKLWRCSPTLSIR